MGFPFAAVLWDMDGTIVDTEPYWMAAEKELVAAHGGTWSTEHQLNLVGRALIDSATYIYENSPVTLRPAEIVETLLDGVVEQVETEVPWRPGARELLAELNAAQVPCALVTMSYLRFAAPILRGLPANTFQAVVTGDRVTHGKPHPEPYLAAASMLGVDPAACLAIEDSDTGATSAEAAGCQVLVVPSHVHVPEGPGRERRETLSGLDLAGLAALR